MRKTELAACQPEALVTTNQALDAASSVGASPDHRPLVRVTDLGYPGNRPKVRIGWVSWPLSRPKLVWFVPTCSQSPRS